VFVATVSCLDTEAAIYAENHQAGRVASAFYERHEQALLAYGRACGEEELAREVLVDALMEWWREKRSGAELQPPLAVSWRLAGQRGTLRAYLQRCLKTRAADRRRALGRSKSLEADGARGGRRELAVEPSALAPDEGRLWRACECWAGAVRAVAERHPQATLCWWLTALCGRQAKAMLKLLYPARGRLNAGGAEWRENPGTVSRLLAQFERERAVQLERARAGTGLTTDDLDEAREQYRACLDWGEVAGALRGQALKKTEQARLAQFAAGMPLAQRKEMIGWLMERPGAVRRLALYLPAAGTRGRAPELDPAAAEDGVRFPADALLAGRRGHFHTEARKRAGAMTAAECLAKLQRDGASGRCAGGPHAGLRR
jgi:hypothetical protein